MSEPTDADFQNWNEANEYMNERPEDDEPEITYRDFLIVTRVREDIDIEDIEQVLDEYGKVIVYDIHEVQRKDDGSYTNKQEKRNHNRRV